MHTLGRAELEDAFNKLPTRRLGEHDGKFLDEHFADAEYDYWARCSMWSVEQATALLLGKDADVVDLLTLRQWNQGHGIAAQFNRLLYRLQEAKERGELTEYMTPTMQVEWARANQIEVSWELIQSVEAHSSGTVAPPALAGGMPDERPVTPNERTGWAKERQSLLKIVAGAVLVAYGDKARGARGVATELKRDLEKYDIHLNDDTIRKWLNEAMGTTQK